MSVAVAAPYTVTDIKGSNSVTHVRVLTAISLRVTLAVNNDDGSNWEWLRDYLSVLNMRSDWF